MGDAIQKTAISSLQEVRNLIKELPAPDLESLKKGKIFIEVEKKKYPALLLEKPLNTINNQ